MASGHVVPAADDRFRDLLAMVAACSSLPTNSFHIGFGGYEFRFEGACVLLSRPDRVFTFRG